MIRFEDLAIGKLGLMDLEVRPGKCCALIMPDEHSKNMLLATLAGFMKPAAGRLTLLGVDPCMSDEHALLELYWRVGVVWAKGRLLSNLKVWENILLPREYHDGTKGADVEPLVIEVFGHFGVTGAEVEEVLQSHPFTLPAHHKAMAALAREMLKEPEVMIYDTIFDGLSPEVARSAISLARDFDTMSQTRSSLYLLLDDDMLHALESDVLLDMRSQ